MSHKFKRNYSLSRQQGNLYIIAVFALVVMGFLGTNLIRIEQSNRDALVRDILGTQAWLLAHSVNEYALTQFYPLNASSAVASNCDPVASGISTGANNVLSNFSNCSSVSITCETIGTLDGMSYFKVESTAVCGSGINEVQRSQEVWIREES
ncbi:MSHA biogenesis protein MshP [Vibrio marisflavi]|uniref:MSHA biogenesis protein MshP n=1 Tax=Vibrio marisflavi CECT 7928 TaxID=634439 RepID=A0ABN8E6V5_9VIBR|nr:MSHA biogenesis protein MshP [Vibrio marisflavi]CAH0541572.1 hypothetical protein VMF7928_03635 [Vibrio marisflavi CECT 7928]